MSVGMMATHTGKSLCPHACLQGHMCADAFDGPHAYARHMMSKLASNVFFSLVWFWQLALGEGHEGTRVFVDVCVCVRACKYVCFRARVE